MVEIYKQKGLSDADATRLIDIITAKPEYKDFFIQHMVRTRSRGAAQSTRFFVRARLLARQYDLRLTRSPRLVQARPPGITYGAAPSSSRAPTHPLHLQVTHELGLQIPGEDDNPVKDGAG